jgi:hypothetical protein
MPIAKASPAHHQNAGRDQAGDSDRRGAAPIHGHLCQTRELTIFQTHREAMGYVDEIAANYSPSFINIAHRIMGRFLDTLFESVTFSTEALSTIKRSPAKGRSFSCPPTKATWTPCCSPYTLYDNHMPCPHVFAGKNLAFWPMAPVFQAGGGLFCPAQLQRRRVLCQGLFGLHLPGAQRRVQHRRLHRGHPQPQRQIAAAPIGHALHPAACLLRRRLQGT